MALFRSLQEVTPLFRMLDECAVASARRGFPSTASSIRSYQPRFDVREVKDTYELHGELPGIAQEDISLQWDDGQTLTISGRTKRTRTESTLATVAPSKTHQPSVEDAPDESGADSSNVESTQPPTAEAAKSEPAEKPRYWLSERAVGEFSRSWKFPGRLDQDNVRASLKDGILSVVVPKSKITPPKKITIE